MIWNPVRINVNQKIKEILKSKGWVFVIPKIRVKSRSLGERMEQKDDAPETVAWKENVTPRQSCYEFCEAICEYDINHFVDDPMKRARGKAFATQHNVYDAIRIE